MTRAFGERTVVDSVSLRVDAGDIHALLGPNGSGKTTTVRMLATLLRPSAGHIGRYRHDSGRRPGNRDRHTAADAANAAKTSRAPHVAVGGMGFSGLMRDENRSVRAAHDIPKEEVIRVTREFPRPGRRVPFRDSRHGSGPAAPASHRVVRRPTPCRVDVRTPDVPRRRADVPARPRERDRGRV